MNRRPENSEYLEYYDRYVRLVPDGPIVAILRDQLQRTLDLLRSVPAEAIDYRYAPGKWSLKEVVGHVIDVEWIFTHRALWFARGNEQALPGMDQDEFVAAANFASRSLADMLLEWEHLRTANIILYDSFDTAILDRSGTASDCRFTVRSIPYIMAGHEQHHINVLKDKYLA